MRLFQSTLSALACAAAILHAAPANAALAPFKVFTGNVGVSTSAWGDDFFNNGPLVAHVPFGAQVLAAYLYTSTYSTASLSGITATLGGWDGLDVTGGTSVSFDSLGTNAYSPSGGGAARILTAGRRDVTNIVKTLIDGTSASGVYTLGVEESSNLQDGEALVVVYQGALLPTNSVAILDGYASMGDAGDIVNLGFAAPVVKSPGFQAELRLGIGFSQGSDPDQVTRVKVNGTVVSEVAGGNDKGTPAIGGLITMGTEVDPFTARGETNRANDHERYDISDLIANGNTSLKIETLNKSHDDNLFLAVLQSSAAFAAPGRVPEPTAPALVGIALLGLALQRRTTRRR